MTQDFKDIIPVLLCGGKGLRLRPLSNAARPKQFFRLKKTGRSLLQTTLLRHKEMAPPVIVTSHAYQAQVEAQCEEIGVKPQAILSEPDAANTGPAIALATHYLLRQGKGASNMLVLPCDHIWEDEGALNQAVVKALSCIGDKMVLFGLNPYAPAVQYGYIEAKKIDFSTPQRVVNFHEKPDVKTARRYLLQGNYYWNSGLVLMNVTRGQRAFEKHAPALWHEIQKIDPLNIHDSAYRFILPSAFDRLILEVAENLMVQPCDTKWADIGSWPVFIRFISLFSLFR